MAPAMRIRVASFCIALLAGASAAWGQSLSLSDQIKDHEQKLGEAKSQNNLRNVAIELNTLGEFYRVTGKTDKALDDFNQALPRRRKIGLSTS